MLHGNENVLLDSAFSHQEREKSSQTFPRFGLYSYVYFLVWTLFIVVLVMVLVRVLVMVMVKVHM